MSSTRLVLAVSVGLLCGCAAFRHSAVMRRGPWREVKQVGRSPLSAAYAWDGTYVYRLGGVYHNIRSGNSYGNAFARYSVKSNAWEDLAPVRFGVGGAALAYWPDGGTPKLVAIAGIEKLGDEFNTNGVQICIYDIGRRSWEVRDLDCPELGRPAYIVHRGGSEFVLLTTHRGLDSGINMALLDLAEPSVLIKGSFPCTSRPIGAARIGNRVYVLDTGSPPWLYRLNLDSLTWEEPVRISGLALGIWDIPFAYKNALLVWRNGSSKDFTYGHNSAVFRVDEETGCAVELHTEFPGPRARAKPSGILAGSSFLVFGGQRYESSGHGMNHEVLVNDTFRYDLPVRGFPRHQNVSTAPATK